MGDKTCFLMSLLFGLLLEKAQSGPASVVVPRPKRIENLTPDEKLRILTERGTAIAAVLQSIENVATRSGNVTCRRTSLEDVAGFQWKQSPAFGGFEKPMEAAIKTANILNHYFMKSANNTELDVLLLHSLARANVASEQAVASSGVALAGGALLLALASPHSLTLSHLERWPGTEWFWRLAAANYSGLFAQASNGSDLVVSAADGHWAAPHFDCNLSTSWHVTYGAPFFARIGEELMFKGAVSVSMPVTDVDIDQCDGRVSSFSSTHHCDLTSTQCVPIQGRGFRRGSYRCYCKPSHYPASVLEQRRGSDYYDGVAIEEDFVANALSASPKYSNSFQCLPCRVGCEMCLTDQPCYVEYDMLLRSLVLCFQSFCSTLAIILSVVVFTLRKTRIFSNSMWVMLETILIGALLLYQTVIIRYFEPSVLTCLLEPWFRGLGFAICYGAITLKIYRVLAEFQTRKAHRVCVRDKDLLKYMLGIILVVVAYLLAWTAVIFDNIDEGVVAHEQTAMGLKYVICRALWWDYVTEVGELLFLSFGVFLTYKVRNAKSDCFHEKETLTWSIYIEALVSLLMYTIRHVVWSNLLPDYIYLLYFLRCQCTVTIILFFIFAPKLWYHARPPEAQDCRQLSSSGDQTLHEAITSNGDVDTNLSDMDPEDIRTELRRVYTQLQILRNITMRKGNPHISRRRGGRKGTHRRFSLQTFHHRHKHHHDLDHEVSKTPEESTASLDGAENRHSEEPDSAPSVTFKE